MGSVLGTLRRPILGSLVLATLLVGTLAGSAAAAPRPISFDVFIGDYCVAGRAKNDSFLKVIVRDADGRLKIREAVEADPQGYWQSCVTFGGAPIVPGDKINVTVFGTGQKRAFTVPTITAKVHRGTNVVSGRAPAGSDVQVEAFDFRFDLWGEQYDVVRDLHSSSTGTYAYDFDKSGVDIKGGARVVIRWRQGSDTVSVGRFQFAPFLTFSLGSSQIAGASSANGLMKVRLSANKGSAAIAAAHGVGSYADTSWYADFAKADGEPYKVKGGEWLSAPALGAASSWRIPAINAATDLAADKIKGKCFANGRFVAIAEGGAGNFGLGFGTATANGSFELGLGDQIDIKKGYRIAVLCYSPEGDEVVSEGTAR